VLPKLKNKYVVVTHVSRRTGIRKAKRILAKRIGAEAMKRIHFLMDLEGAHDAGEIEELAPPPPDTAE
jgi:hypothetical protein